MDGQRRVGWKFRHVDYIRLSAVAWDVAITAQVSTSDFDLEQAFEGSAALAH